MEREIKNARIEGTSLGREDHGILTCMISLNYGGSGQGFGGYSLDGPRHEGDKFLGRYGTAWGMEFIKRVLETVGAERWEDLKGKHVRADCEHSHVHGIGHVIENKWFYPERDLKNFEESAALGRGGRVR